MAALCPAGKLIALLAHRGYKRFRVACCHTEAVSVDLMRISGVCHQGMTAAIQTWKEGK